MTSDKTGDVTSAGANPREDPNAASADEALDAEAVGEESAASRHLGWALVLISIAQLMVVLDASIANIALPYIGADLGIDQANLTWIVTGYALTFGGLLLLGGRLGDLYGRRTIFMIGLTGFALASLVGGIAQNEATLLASRGAQGAFAALASPNALALIATTFPAGPKRSRAMGVFAMMSGVGAAVGLILGGWLTGTDSFFGAEISGWRLTFLINVPVGITAALLAPRVLPDSERHTGWLDVPGAVTGTAGLLAIVFGLSRAGQDAYGWDHWQTLASLGAGFVLLIVFILIETKVKHPLLPLGIFKNQSRAATFAAMMIAPAAMFAMFFFLSLFVQQVMGYEPLEAGFAFLPFSVAMIFGAGLSSQLISKINPRFIAGTGTLLAAVALFGFSTITVDDSATDVLNAFQSGDPLGADVNYWTHILPWILVMAFGMGLTFVTLTLTAVHGIAAKDTGAGSGVLNTMQQVGGALGLAILGAISTHYANDHAESIGPAIAKAIPDPTAAHFATEIGAFPIGAHHAFIVGAVMMVAASLIIWLFLSVRHEELAQDGDHEALPIA